MNVNRINDMINFDDDIIEVYKGREIVWHGTFDEYFYNKNEFYDNFKYDDAKKVYIGLGPAKGWKVRKVK